MWASAKRSKTIRVHGLHYVIEEANADDSAAGGRRRIRLRQQHPGAAPGALREDAAQHAAQCEDRDTLVQAGQQPDHARLDYFLHKTDAWIVFPHELAGLTFEEIEAGRDRAGAGAGPAAALKGWAHPPSVREPRARGRIFVPTIPCFAADPYPAYARPPGDEPGLLFSADRTDAVRALPTTSAAFVLDGRLGRSTDHLTTPEELAHRRREGRLGQRCRTAAATSASTCSETEGADHARVRRLVAAAFGPRRIRDLRERVRALVEVCSTSGMRSRGGWTSSRI